MADQAQHEHMPAAALAQPLVLSSQLAPGGGRAGVSRAMCRRRRVAAAGCELGGFVCSRDDAHVPLNVLRACPCMALACVRHTHFACALQPSHALSGQHTPATRCACSRLLPPLPRRRLGCVPAASHLARHLLRHLCRRGAAPQASPGSSSGLDAAQHAPASCRPPAPPLRRTPTPPSGAAALKRSSLAQQAAAGTVAAAVGRRRRRRRPPGGRPCQAA